MQSQPTLEDALLQPFPDCHLSGSSDNAALRVRAIALYERTARFSSCMSPFLPLHTAHPRSKLTHTFALRARPASRDESRGAQEAAVAQGAAALGALGGPQYGVPFLVANVDRAALETFAHAATIHLCRDELELARDAYQRCVWAANRIVAIIHTVADADYELLYPMLAVSLAVPFASLSRCDWVSRTCQC